MEKIILESESETSRILSTNRIFLAMFSCAILFTWIVPGFRWIHLIFSLFSLATIFFLIPTTLLFELKIKPRNFIELALFAYSIGVILLSVIVGVFCTCTIGITSKILTTIVISLGILCLLRHELRTEHLDWGFLKKEVRQFLLVIGIVAAFYIVCRVLIQFSWDFPHNFFIYSQLNPARSLVETGTLNSDWITEYSIDGSPFASYIGMFLFYFNYFIYYLSGMSLLLHLDPISFVLIPINLFIIPLVIYLFLNQFFPNQRSINLGLSIISILFPADLYWVIDISTRFTGYILFFIGFYFVLKGMREKDVRGTCFGLIVVIFAQLYYQTVLTIAIVFLLAYDIFLNLDLQFQSGDPLKSRQGKRIRLSQTQFPPSKVSLTRRSLAIQKGLIFAGIFYCIFMGFYSLMFLQFIKYLPFYDQGIDLFFLNVSRNPSYLPALLGISIGMTIGISLASLAINWLLSRLLKKIFDKIKIPRITKGRQVIFLSITGIFLSLSVLFHYLPRSLVSLILYGNDIWTGGYNYNLSQIQRAFMFRIQWLFEFVILVILFLEIYPYLKLRQHRSPFWELIFFVLYLGFLIVGLIPTGLFFNRIVLYSQILFFLGLGMLLNAKEPRNRGKNRENPPLKTQIGMLGFITIFFLSNFVQFNQSFMENYSDAEIQAYSFILEQVHQEEKPVRLFGILKDANYLLAQENIKLFTPIESTLIRLIFLSNTTENVGFWAFDYYILNKVELLAGPRIYDYPINPIGEEFFNKFQGLSHLTRIFENSGVLIYRNELPDHVKEGYYIGWKYQYDAYRFEEDRHQTQQLWATSQEGFLFPGEANLMNDDAVFFGDVYQFDGYFYLIYQITNRTTQSSTIYTTRSPTLEKWNFTSAVPIMSFDSDSEERVERPPRVIQNSSIIHMFYVSRNESCYTIRKKTSTDGYTWNSPRDIISVPNTTSIETAGVVKFNNTYTLMYKTQNQSQSYIGILESSDLINFSKPCGLPSDGFCSLEGRSRWNNVLGNSCSICVNLTDQTPLRFGDNILAVYEAQSRRGRRPTEIGIAFANNSISEWKSLQEGPIVSYDPNKFWKCCSVRNPKIVYEADNNRVRLFYEVSSGAFTGIHYKIYTMDQIHSILASCSLSGN